VCFRCAGTGRVKAGKVKPPKPMTEYQVTLATRITSDDLSNLGYGELMKLRDFAHWPFPQMPNLLNVWFERGECHFQERQANMLDNR